MFPLLYSLFILGIVFYDRVFLFPVAGPSWRILAAGFIVAAYLSIDPRPLAALTNWLGVGRPVDAVIYVLLVLLVREIFVWRVRFSRMERKLTLLVRETAIRTAQQEPQA